MLTVGFLGKVTLAVILNQEVGSMGNFGGFEILLVTIIVFFIVVPIVAIIDIVRSDFYGNKIVWVLVVLFLGAVGAFIYYFIGTKQKV